MTCAEAVSGLLKHQRASRGHHLLVRRHLKTGDLAFHYCSVPEGQLLTKTRLIRAAGLRWPVEEDFEFGHASVAHCAFFSSGVLEQSSLAGFDLDTASAACAADVHGGEFAALDHMQNGLPGGAESGGCLPQREPALWRVFGELGPQRVIEPDAPDGQAAVQLALSHATDTESRHAALPCRLITRRST